MKNEKKRLSMEEYIIGAIMIVMFLVTVSNVFCRFVINVSFAFTEEATTYLFACLCFIGASIACLHGANMGMEAIVMHLPAKAQKFFVWFGTAFSIALYGLLAVQGVQLVFAQLRSGLATPSLGVPNWIYSLAVPLGGVLYIIRAVQYVLRCCRALDLDPGVSEAGGERS